MSRESRVESRESGPALLDSRLSTLDSPARVAILGVGLIGGSLALALRRAPGTSFTLAGYDCDPATVRQALAAGALDRAAETPAEAAADADLVVLAAPVGATAPLLRAIVDTLPPRAVVTDVGSTKARVVAECEALLPGRFVGGHPMAGSERSGFDAASADLFAGSRWFVTPTAGTRPDAVAMVEALARAVGATPRRCDPALHDRIVAAVSHLPHLLGFGLAQTAADRVAPEWRDVTAGSFRDGTRVAGSAPALWADILLDNRDAVLDALAAQTDWLDAARATLEAGDATALRSLLESAHAARAAFPPGEKA